MLRKLFLLFFFLLVLVSHGLAQTNTPLTIDTIAFEGLKKTAPSFLRRFIQSKEGQPTDVAQLKTDVQMLKNRASVADVSYRIDTLGEHVRLIFSVSERKTLFPIINFGGIKDNFWFRLGFWDNNWLGRGQFFSAHYQNTDRRHSGKIYYRIPYSKNGKWGYTFSLERWASREPLFFTTGTTNYDYDNNSVGLGLIRNFGLRRNAEIGLTYFVEKYEKSELQLIDMPPGPEGLTQPKFLTKFEFSEHLIDYDFYTLKGRDWRVTLQNVYNTLDGYWFNSLQFQGRQFFKVGGLGNVAMRLRLAISTNNDSPFAPFVVDSHVNLRGVGNRIDRGTAQAVFNLEYRQGLFALAGWGAQVVVFSDLGTWRNPGRELKQIFDSDQFRHFVGGGIRLIYQQYYGAVLRIDYGIDVYNRNQRGFVIGLGQYF